MMLLLYIAWVALALGVRDHQRQRAVPAVLLRQRHLHHGRSVQVEPIKPTFKARGTKHLKLKHDKLLSISTCAATPRRAART